MFIKFIADGTLVLILLVCVPIVVYRIRKTFWQSASVIVMASLSSLLVGKLLSLVYQPSIARPFLTLGVNPGAAYINNPGFPSDHALLATVAVVAAYAVTRSRLLVAGLSLLVVIMCIGRVLALVHTPLDVIFGVLAGLSGAFWYQKLTK